MRLVRFNSGGSESFGFVLGDAVVDLAAAAVSVGLPAPPVTSIRELIEAGPVGWAQAQAIVDAAATATVPSTAIDSVTLLHPYRPRKNIVRGGGNSGMNGDKPKDHPVQKLPYYTKAPTSVADPGSTITWPTKWANQVYAEPQLAIVVGSVLSYASPEEALAGVFGYAVATDVTSYDLMLKHGQWPKAVSLDSFFPWGPVLVTADEVADPNAVTARLYLNDELVIEGSTGDALLSIGEMLAELSFGIRLEPGDVLLLGAPESLGFGYRPERWLRDGDVVRSELIGIGEITNPVQSY